MKRLRLRSLLRLPRLSRSRGGLRVSLGLRGLSASVRALGLRVGTGPRGMRAGFSWWAFVRRVLKGR